MSDKPKRSIPNEALPLPHLCAFMAERSPQPMVAVEGKTHLVRYVNPAFRQLLSIEDQELIGRRFEEAVPEGLANTCAAMLDRVFDTGTSEALIEQEHGPDVWANGVLAAKGPARWSYLAWAVLGLGGKPEGVMIQVTDTTEPARFRKVAASVNEALLVSGLKQHELTDSVLALNTLLRQSEQRLQTMADAMPQLAWMARADGFRHWYNKRWYEYTGTTLSEMEGWGWQSIHDPLVLPRVLERWKVSIATGEPFEMMFPLRGKDGAYRLFLTRAEPQINAQGNITQWFGTSTDIDEAQRATNALRESEERLQALVTASSDVVYRMSADWAVLYPFDGQDFIASTKAPTRDWLTKNVHPDDQAQVTAAIEQAIGSKGVFQLEHRVRRVDGNWGWTLSRAVPLLDAAGAINEWFGAASDVTDRKRAEESLRSSEERYRTLFTSIDEGFCIIEKVADNPGDGAGGAAGDPPDFRYVEANPAFEVQSGISDVVGKTIRQIFPTIGEEWLKTYYGVLVTGAPIRFERNLATDGRVLEVYAFRIEDGINRRVAVIFKDITARKQAEEALRSSEAQERTSRTESEAANRSKDTFLATLSHELRTPLNAILGWAVLLRTTPLPDGQPVHADIDHGLAIIERNARAQGKLIEDVLDVARITSGKFLLDSQPLELTNLVFAAVDAVRPAAKDKGLSLEVAVGDGSGSLWVNADSSRLQQAISNLLTNAVKFTQKGGSVVVSVDLVKRTGPRAHTHAGTYADTARLTVTDTGRGIDAKFLSVIFEPFKQAGEGTTRSYGGLGLGLSVVRHIMQAHGGTARAASQGEGKGATFILELPATPHDAAPLRLERVISPVVPPRLDGVRVLVVDDEEDSRLMAKRVLESAGASVLLAASAQEGYHLAVKVAAGPQVVVSDIGMPGEDGYSMIQRVRSEKGSKDLPAVAMTAFAAPEDKRRALVSGFQAHIAKPVDPQELIAVVAGLAGLAGLADGESRTGV